MTNHSFTIFPQGVGIYCRLFYILVKTHAHQQCAQSVRVNMQFGIQVKQAQRVSRMTKRNLAEYIRSAVTQVIFNQCAMDWRENPVQSSLVLGSDRCVNVATCFGIC